MSRAFHYCPRCKSLKLAQLIILEDFHAHIIDDEYRQQCPDCGYTSRNAADWQHEHEAPTPAELKRRQITLNL